jgi:hypothetical protein
MKADRRHELQTNSLALWLRWRLPQLLEQYGTRILLGLILLAILILFVRWRISAPREAAARANFALAQAEQQVDALRQFRTTPDSAGEVPRHIQNATQESSRPDVQGRAYMLLGDYYWALYSFPELPGAATQPALRPELEPTQLLERASEAYQKVLSIQNVPPHLAGAARLGLGVVAETRAFNEDRRGGPEQAGRSPQWAVAREQYETITRDEGYPVQLRREAEWHLENLPRLQSPVWLVEVPDEELEPAPLPVGPLGPELPPGDQPAGAPIQPGPQPAAQPATQPAAAPAAQPPAAPPAN